jgi:hypothetical protein
MEFFDKDWIEFFEKHWAAIVMAGIGLWLVYKSLKIGSAKDEAELAVGYLSGKENWLSVQKISILRQINIDFTLERIEFGLYIIILLLMFIAFKQI